MLSMSDQGNDLFLTRSISVLQSFLEILNSLTTSDTAWNDHSLHAAFQWAQTLDLLLIKGGSSLKIGLLESTKARFESSTCIRIQ